MAAAVAEIEPVTPSPTATRVAWPTVMVALACAAALSPATFGMLPQVARHPVPRDAQPIQAFIAEFQAVMRQMRQTVRPATLASTPLHQQRIAQRKADALRAERWPELSAQPPTAPVRDHLFNLPPPLA